MDLKNWINNGVISYSAFLIKKSLVRTQMYAYTYYNMHNVHKQTSMRGHS